MDYRVALVGAGNMGRTHAQQWEALPGAELVGVQAETRAEAQPLADAMAGRGRV